MLGTDLPVFDHVWAKTGFSPEGIPMWLSLRKHLEDAGEVADHLWLGWLSASAREMLANEFDDEDMARSVAGFLSATHDIGKLTPAFVIAAPATHRVLVDRVREVGLPVPAELPDRSSLPHGLASHLIMSRRLTEMGYSKKFAASLAVIVGGHHGAPPSYQQLQRSVSCRHLLGEGTWEGLQNRIVDQKLGDFRMNDALAAIDERGLSQTAQILLSGLVIMADWIASNANFFPLMVIDDLRPRRAERTGRAMSLLELPMPWLPTNTDEDASDRIAIRFDLPVGTRARPVQEAALQTSNEMDSNGLMIVEAPMGEGKTEAALLAVESLARRRGCSGCMLALPTQATTDAMFARMLAWLARLPDSSEDVRVAAHSINLAHGKARFNTTFRDLAFGEHLSGVGEDELVGGSGRRGTFVRAYVEPWTSGRKKGLLSDFVVCTIDQLLFAGLRSRHLVLRHLGLSTKVVVIDEVHAYDAYMGTYLLRVLEWMGAYGIPVVLLSATLPTAVRQSLMNAYLDGRQTSQPELFAQGRFTSGGSVEEANSNDGHEITNYPRITYVSEGAVKQVSCASTDRDLSVRISCIPDDDDSLISLLAERLSRGGCALVVRNTVTRAQHTSDFLRRAFNSEPALLHARFTTEDRIRKDTWLRSTFGRGRESFAGASPRIVVATQVVEQSLDVDFDLIVSDLAPIDLMLQRMGRLHRHADTLPASERPERVREPSFVVTGVADWIAEPPALVTGSVMVYGDLQLLRAIAVLGLHEAQELVVRLPDDISNLVERAYGSETITPRTWEAAMEDAVANHSRRVERSTRKAGAFLVGRPRERGAIIEWIEGSVGEADESVQGRAQVREGTSGLEILLIRRRSDGAIGSASPLEIADVFPWDEEPNGRLAERIARSAIRLPTWISEFHYDDALIRALELHGYSQAWQSNPLLRGQLILILDESGEKEVAGLHFSYNSKRGLEVVRSDK